MNTLIIRDGHAVINGDKTTFECKSGSLEILADGGRVLFAISLDSDGLGRISVWSGSHCKHGGKMFEDKFVIVPHSSNVFDVQKTEYKPKK